MCLFPRFVSPKSKAYEKGIKFFKCGCCPECMRSKATPWALRATYESKKVPTVMVTLTYDNYVHDGQGRIIGERVDTRELSKRDAQLFIKRLRKHFVDRKIRYILTAERGKRTDRAHYHAILFNVVFDDLVFYKKSKRGNIIYKSKTLTDIWHNGICTVDSVNVSSACARYCTKYCAKDNRGADDTFMLFSHGIGEEGLLEDFNGKNYILEGVEYSIPRLIWRKKLSQDYSALLGGYDYIRYVNLREDCSNLDEYLQSQTRRRFFSTLRDNDPLYMAYRDYWQRKIEEKEKNSPSEFERILALPNDKYFSYKQAAIGCYNWNKAHVGGLQMPPPRSNSISDVLHSLNWSPRDPACVNVARYVVDYVRKNGYRDSELEFMAVIKADIASRHLAYPSRPYTPNDTTQIEQLSFSEHKRTQMNINEHKKRQNEQHSINIQKGY